MAPGVYWPITAVLVAVLIGIAVWAFQTANRLDRLHVRYDLSWQALDSALARRAVVPLSRSDRDQTIYSKPRRAGKRRMVSPCRFRSTQSLRWITEEGNGSARQPGQGETTPRARPPDIRQEQPVPMGATSINWQMRTGVAHEPPRAPYPAS
jgi:hypothetical protein